MPGNAGLFAVQLDREFEEIEDQFMDVLQGVAIRALRGVVQKTPVDTGRARGSWIVSIGTASDELPEEKDKQPLGSDPNASKLIEAGRKLAQMRQPDTIYIQSNLPYIDALESGHSQAQAPNGMVALTVAELEAIFAVTE